MVNFIIKEERYELREKYEIAILNFLGSREEKFKIYDYDNYRQENYNRNIYILGESSIEKALEVAQKIRENNDWTSQIIIVSDTENIKMNLLNNDLLILNYIEETSQINNTLKEALYKAYNILNYDQTLNFHLNGELFKIPYSSIYYIEKGNNQNYCIIHTKNDTFTIKETINGLEEKLDLSLFMKTHRSCIINLATIKKYDTTNSIVYFENLETDMIARDKRPILQMRLYKEKMIN